jgi:formylglycine-generating enzyme required for sulfatase activity
LYHIGYEGDEFAFDNEGPRHREFLNAFSLASRLVINEEYQQFMADGGYTQTRTVAFCRLELGAR